MSLSELEKAAPIYGPGISVAVNLDEHHRPIEVRLSKFGENLSEDFPNLTQEDWDRSALLLVDGLNDRSGGAVVDLQLLRESRSERILFWLRGKAKTFLLQDPSMPSARWFNDRSNGKDFLAVINVGSRVRAGERHKHYKRGQKLNLSLTIPHEVQHMADFLKNKTADPSRIDKLKRQSRATLGYLSVFAIGGLAATAGFTELLYSGYYRDISENLVVTGSGLFVGGLATSAAVAYSKLKLKGLSDERFGIDRREMTLDEMESRAELYSLETEDKWQDVVQYGAQI